MARRTGITYDADGPKYRGSDLKRPADDLVKAFSLADGLVAMFHRMVPAFPRDAGRLAGWADHATGGLYSLLRERHAAYHYYFQAPYGNQHTATFRLADPTGGSLMFGLMRGKAVRLGLAGVLPPPVPTGRAIEAPSTWVDDKPVTEWVRTVLKAEADQKALHCLLVHVVGRTRLRPWAILAAFSPAWAGYYGHRFRPTSDLWQAVKEPDIAFVEKLMPDLLMRARHPPVDGQSVMVEEAGR